MGRARDDRLLVVGRVGGVYGVRGWVRLQSFTDPMENLLAYEGWQLGRGGRWRPIVIDAGERHGKGLIVHIAGLDDRDEAAKLRGSEIAVPAAALPALEDDEFYWHQLAGLEVWSGGELLGQVDHLLETGANDVLVVKPGVGSRDTRERLIPWLRDEVVRAVDLEGGRIDVDWDPEF